MVKKILNSAMATAGILSVLGFIASRVDASTFIFLDSPPGDFIGGGIQQTFTPLDGFITASRNFDNGISINFEGDDFWRLDFAAPNNEVLILDAYENATRFPFQSSTSPGLSVSGAGRGCNTLTGGFDILDVSYVANGTVERFNANFAQSCEGTSAPLLGQVRFDQATSVASPEEIKNNIQMIDSSARTKLLSFSDQITEFSTALYFFSEPGDFIGGGIERIFTPDEFDFNISNMSDSLFSVNLNNYSEFWSLDFSVPEVLSLTPGDYGKATRYPFNSPTQPGLSIRGAGRGCNTLSGQFIVLDSKYVKNQGFESFDAIFEQHCEEGAPALWGRIRHNAVTTLPASVPEPRSTIAILILGAIAANGTQRER